jgi:hypothetical protein
MYWIWSLILTANLLGSIAKVLSGDSSDDPVFAHTTPLHLASIYIPDSYY